MKFKTSVFSGLLALAALTSTNAHAATSIELNTGEDEAPADGVDDNWKVDGNDAFVPTDLPGSYTENPNSLWITPLLDGDRPGTIAAGEYVFSTTVDLSSLGDLINWSGTVWVDNAVSFIRLGGVTLFGPETYSGVPAQHAGSGLEFSFNQTIDSSNPVLIEIGAYNAPGSGYNPTAMNVFSVFTAVPEPGTWMLMIFGLGAVGFSMRRRRDGISARLQFA